MRRSLPPQAGWRWRAGAVDLVAVGPPYPLRGSRSDPNNNSLVLTATVAGVRILLAGDAETEEQRAMLETMPAAAIRADVLKVAHHGSAYQDPEFLAAVRPAVALVCVGRRQRLRASQRRAAGPADPGRRAGAAYRHRR